MEHAHTPSDFYLEHAHCVLYDRPVILLDLIGNVMVGLAYIAIPVFLLRLIIGMWRTMPKPFRPLIVHGSAFVVLCGATHFIAAWNWYNTWYMAQAYAQATTGVVSFWFAWRLFFFIRNRAWET